MTTVAGVRLPQLSAGAVPDKDEFILKTASNAFRIVEHLAMAVACGQPVLLRGPTGCGKTAMVEYVARQTGRIPEKFFKVQLGQETDSRVLLGGYQVTDTPGQFLWKPGVLTKAVLEGYWILLEDVNCASSDVITLISSLAKNGSMAVPGFSDNVQPHSDLVIFATERTFSNDLENTCPALPDWLVLDCPALSASDLQAIIEIRWPKLTSISSRLVSLLTLESWENCHNRPSSRGLFRLCERANGYYVAGSAAFALRLFNDAVDILCGCFSKQIRTMAATQVGLALGIVENKASFLGSAYKPTVTMMGTKLCVGRIILQQEPEKELAAFKKRRTVFSLTRPTCVLMEQIACCVDNLEPVLLVGETGCGKTSSLQYLAEVLNKKLVVINMSQQSETVDLLGGFKPVSFKYLIQPLLEQFENLFRATFDNDKNEPFWIKMKKFMADERWNMVLEFMTHVYKRAMANLKEKINQDETPPRKKLKINAKNLERSSKWEQLGEEIQNLGVKLKAAEKCPVFAFVEGTLVKAIKNGDWVLLDEINLASSETLDCLHGLLENRSGSLILLERGDLKPISRNDSFRLFAAMNPATDVGKSQLPVGLRNRFTEFFVDELDSELDLLPIIQSYLEELNPSPEKIKNLAQFYLNIKHNHNILDGNGRPPHYSLRSLCRALMVASKNPCGNAARSTFEGLCLSFLTQLDANSYENTVSLVLSSVIGSGVSKSVLRQPIPKPNDGSKKFINIEGYWLPVGSLDPDTPENYILTNTVKRHLKDLLRVVALGEGIPVLLEGDTSVGKTSLVSYLAKCTGNVCARLNNHEHTDIQEYIGTYVADDKGKLVFKEGILCEAMRKGYWLILDELNLAPTEVLEALNRVLDDNRELLVSETQTVIQAHPGFQLFATQNPTGIYGGRKELSRAFRNRFVELHVTQIPSDELTEILHRRCEMPMGYCKKMVAVMGALQTRRRGSEIFVGKSGFITLRDLFRWGERYQLAEKKQRFYDWEQHLADEGYILLTGRVRIEEERKIIQEVLFKHFKKNVDPHNLFSLHENTSAVTRDILEKVLSFSCSDPAFNHIVWTYSLRRLAVLVCKAILFKEPILIVGETGCGKTSVIQILSKMHQRELFAVNCHMHSESADFLGGLRPVRNSSRDDGKLFEWVDGPLVSAVLTGSWFLADEISLADDSVLERLNSLLEPERTLLLVEKGGALNKEQEIQAADGFSFLGTMNPGGDYGKKELSPALRNRMTEIWAGVSDDIFKDYRLIAVHNIKNPPEPFNCEQIADFMVAFIEWFKKAHLGRKIEISVRDLLTWIDFVNNTVMAGKMSLPDGLLHGCLLTFLDCLSAEDALKINSIQYLKENLQIFGGSDVNFEFKPFEKSHDMVGSHPFYIPVGPNGNSTGSHLKYDAPTTLANVAKVLRGMQTGKAILMEGSPGVGKTSLIEALAKDAGVCLTRINLSEQTDVSDLFGADLPEEGGSAGHFEWRDGAFLTALKESHWILLDELNLASQSVLEGLNAVLDHRGQLFVPELNKTFRVPVGTKLFACQNPLSEGGNRRGLPRSFLNRFTRIYIETLTSNDYQVILKDYIPELLWKRDVINLMIEFSDQLNKLIQDGKLGILGGPWELNLRDLIRWCRAITDHDDPLNCFRVMDTLYVRRFRTVEDRKIVGDTYRRIGLPGGDAETFLNSPTLLLTKSSLHIEDVTLDRIPDEFHGTVMDLKALGCPVDDSIVGRTTLVRPLVHQLPILQILGRCIQNNWLPILVGKSGTGKSSVVKTMAALTRHRLRVMAVSSAMDTTEILGGYEQAAVSRQIENVSSRVQVLVLSAAWRLVLQGRPNDAGELVAMWMKTSSTTSLPDDGMNHHVSGQLDGLTFLLNHGAVGVESKSLCDGLLCEIDRLKNISHGYLTNAGRFEWVDSPLVKCLRDGSWLLLEDVNLCSNAVLDRLNAVVEPGGVLAIGERGAMPDGSVFTITPHKNFRMFFTMNPRNGAISRAMRNRGVEIFLTDDGNVNGSDLDMAALVRDQDALFSSHDGLSSPHEILSIHRELSTHGDYNLGHLVSLAFWTIGSKIYKEPSFDFTNIVDLVYKRKIENKFENSKESLLDLQLARPTPSSIIWNPDLANISQSTAWINALIAAQKNFSENALSYHLLHVFLTTPSYLVKDLSRILLKKLEKYSKHVELVKQCCGILPLELTSMPWDMRWFRHGLNVNGHVNCLFGYIVHLFDKTIFETTYDKKSGYITLKQYSDAVNNGLMMDRFKEEGNLASYEALYSPFLNSIHELIELVLLNASAQWSEKNINDFLETYLWIARLRRIGSANLIKRDKRETVIHATTSKLDLYMHWALEKFLKPFYKNFPQMPNNGKREAKYQKCLKYLKRTDLVLKSQLGKKSAALRKLLNSPKPSVDIRLAISSQKPQDNLMLFFVYHIVAAKLRLQLDCQKKFDGDLFSRILNAFSTNHSLDVLRDDNLLEQKLNLLRLVDLGFYDDSELLVMHRPVIVKECLKKLFPIVPVNLVSLEQYQMDCGQTVALALPHFSEISNLQEYDSSALETVSLIILKLLSNQNWLGCKTDFESKIDFILANLRDLSNAGCGWLLLGTVQIMVLGMIYHDPIQKKLTKLENSEWEALETELQIKCHYDGSEINPINLNHVYINYLRNFVKMSRDAMERHNHLLGLARDAELFISFRNECQSSGKQLINRALDIVKRFRNSDESDGFFESIRISVVSLRVIIQQFEERFLAHFPDLVLPHLYALQQMVHGFCLILNEPRNYNANVQTMMVRLCEFPVPFVELEPLTTDLKTIKTLTNFSPWLRVSLLVANLQNLVNQCVLSRNDGIQAMLGICGQLVAEWKESELRREKEEAEKESLYLTKGTTKCLELTEDEELDLEQEKLFPSYSDKFQTEIGLNYEAKKISKPVIESSLLNIRQMSLVCRMHSYLINSAVLAPWIHLETANSGFDIVGPLTERFQMMNSVFDSNVSAVKSTLDQELLPAMMVMLNEKVKTNSIDENDWDMYTEANLNESRRCLPVLNALKRRIDDLLLQWPDHVTLVQIKTVMERVAALPADSPLMCFLTGMEFIMKACEQWEVNAHAGVSLADELVQIKDLIISWRKMEVQGWKKSLENVRNRMKRETSKWWFNLWMLVEEFLQNDDGEMNVVLQALADFVELSPLGEFSERLSILKSFHGHILLLSKKKFTEFSSRIWNLWRFYCQFEIPVEMRITKITAPVVEKLKDFVKICKWHTISYFSLIQAIDKTHRTLLKHIKEYEKLLKQKVDLLGLDPIFSEGLKDDPVLDINLHFQVGNAAKEKVVALSGEKFQKPAVLLEKTRKFCKNSAENSPYSGLLASVDDLVEQVITNLEHFGNVTPDSTLTPEKQKSQAKSLQQQKRRALADLFQVLAKLGLSYRAGSLGGTWSALELSKGTPFSSQRTGKLSADDYCMKSFARFLRLQQKLLIPSKEIGPPVIDRIRGFSIQLLNLLQDIHETLDVASAKITSLKNMAHIFEGLNENQSIPRQTDLKENFKKFRDIVQNVVYAFKQFGLILNAWPEQMEIDRFIPEEEKSALLSSSKTDEKFKIISMQYSKTMEKTEQILKTIDECLPNGRKFKIATSAGLIGIAIDESLFLTENEEKKFVKCFAAFQQVLHDIEQMRQLSGRENPIFKCLNFAESKKTELENLKNYLEQTRRNETNQDLLEIKTKTENAVEQMLIGVQKIVKRGKIVEKEEEENLHQNHLTVELVENLKSSFDDLSLDNVETILFELLSNVEESNSATRPILASVAPFLSQYVGLASYFFQQLTATYRSTAKLTSVLMGVFLLVAEKGYCAPPELDGEGVDGPEGSGFGLGEGEGKTDVSDRIESEDQLEDARPEGEQREEEENPDCPEEEKGIETSQDFGGKAQDIDKKDDDDEDNNENDDDEEPDKEMGETESGAEQLDKEMWDSEDEEGNNDDLPEDQGGGQQFGEDELGADEEGDQKHDKNKQDVNNDVNDAEEDSEQVDPYHGEFQPPIEPEPMDLPEDLQLDDEDGKEDGDNEDEENPFDIDEMKEPPDFPEENEDNQNNDEMNDDADAEDGEDNNNEDNDNEENSAENVTGDGPEGEPESENPENNDSFKPSDDKPSDAASVQAAPQTANNLDNQSTDMVSGNSNQNEAQNPQEKNEQEQNENVGVGQADLDQSSSGHDATTAKHSANRANQEMPRKRSSKPGKSDQDRSLGDKQHSDAKRMRTVEKDDRDGVSNDDENKIDKNQVDLVQHARDGKMEALDTAAENQSEFAVEPENEGLDPAQDMEVGSDDDEDDDIKVDEIKSNSNQSKSNKSDEKGTKEDGDDPKIMVDGQVIETQGAARGLESSVHAQLSLLSCLEKPLDANEVQALRKEIQNQLATLPKGSISAESRNAWQLITSTIEVLARELTEQLRLILEPSLASRLKGDYRTGRRINMRKVISYIASDFRKDRIWLRRTKPWKREHQIILAIDDSSSMADNQSKELAFESVALVTKALTFLEAGDLSLMSFGESARVLHAFGEPFTDENGSRLLTEMTFEQKRTKMREAIDVAITMFSGARRPNACQLLLIVSDGRGVFSEGLDPVRLAVRRALTAGVFIVFLVIDDPKASHSIIDIRQPEFKDGQYTGAMKGYMENFPFPYYLILRDIGGLPGTLSDALRQWFQITAPPPSMI